jgi:hypothetical protein
VLIFSRSLAEYQMHINTVLLAITAAHRQIKYATM